MGWKGTLRTIQAEIRRSEKEAERRQKNMDKLQTLKEAEDKVNTFENYIAQITQIHTECTCKRINWEKKANQNSPPQPKRTQDNENKAKYELEHFKPNFLHKVLKWENKKKESLKRAIEKAINEDEEEYQNKLRSYQEEYEEWKTKNSLAKKVIEKNPKAFTKAIKLYNPFTDIEELGVSLTFSVDEQANMTVTIVVHSDNIVPKEKYSLRQSGTLSAKNMPKGEFNKLYQDYICSCILRVASELFTLIPLECVIINANDNLLNSQTGHVEEQTILSVMVMKKTFESLNLAKVDPSDAMKNFLCNMQFKQTTGFKVVESLDFKKMQEA